MVFQDEWLKERERDREQELADLEGYITDMWRFFPIPLAYANPMGIIMDVGNSFSEFVKMPKEEIIGLLFSEVFSNAEEISVIEKEILEKGAVKNRGLYLTNQEGQQLPISLSAMARKDVEGHLIGYFITLIDLSETRKMQQALETKLAELEEFHDLAIGRELKMIELEKEINRLLQELGREPKYT